MNMEKQVETHEPYYFDSISAISAINSIDPAQVDIQFMDIIIMRLSILTIIWD